MSTWFVQLLFTHCDEFFLMNLVITGYTICYFVGFINIFYCTLYTVHCLKAALFAGRCHITVWNFFQLLHHISYVFSLRHPSYSHTRKHLVSENESFWNKLLTTNATHIGGYISSPSAPPLCEGSQTLDRYLIAAVCQCLWRPSSLSTVIWTSCVDSLYKFNAS